MQWTVERIGGFIAPNFSQAHGLGNSLCTNAPPCPDFHGLHRYQINSVFNAQHGSAESALQHRWCYFARFIANSNSSSDSMPSLLVSARSKLRATPLKLAASSLLILPSPLRSK